MWAVHCFYKDQAAEVDRIAWAVHTHASPGWHRWLPNLSEVLRTCRLVVIALDVVSGATCLQCYYGAVELEVKARELGVMAVSPRRCVAALQAAKAEKRARQKAREKAKKAAAAAAKKEAERDREAAAAAAADPEEVARALQEVEATMAACAPLCSALCCASPRSLSRMYSGFRQAKTLW